MQRKINFELLQQLDDFIPTLFSVNEVNQSDRTKLIIQHLSQQANELVKEISIVRIQCLVRIFLSKCRVQRLREKLALDNYFAQILSDRLLEESCTAFIVKTCLDLCEYHNETVATKNSVEMQMIQIAGELLDDVLIQMLSRLGILAIKEAVQNYMDSR